MELVLTVRAAGSAPVTDAESRSAPNWQRLSKIVRAAHRPVTFDVAGLQPDTRLNCTKTSETLDPQPHSGLTDAVLDGAVHMILRPKHVFQPQLTLPPSGVFLVVYAIDINGMRFEISYKYASRSVYHFAVLRYI